MIFWRQRNYFFRIEVESTAVASNALLIEIILQLLTIEVLVRHIVRDAVWDETARVARGKSVVCAKWLKCLRKLNTRIQYFSYLSVTLTLKYELAHLISTPVEDIFATDRLRKAHVAKRC